MTIIFYKVGDFFTKSYFEVQRVFIETKNPVEKCFVEFSNIDNLEEISKVTIEKLVDKYNRK
mgnify:CR=1 FL=1